MESTKTLRFIVFAQTQEESEALAKRIMQSENNKLGYFKSTFKNYEFNAFCRWSNNPKGIIGSPSVDAIIVSLREPKDWGFIKEALHSYSLVQFRILLIPSTKQSSDLDQAQSETKANITINFESFSSDEILNHIIKAEEETNSLLKTVFANLDKSGDGFIDLTEMETICRELGVDVTHAEFQETLRSLDINHDNKIGFDEFVDWWKKGRQCSKLMEYLISMKIVTSSFLKKCVDSQYLQFIKSKCEKAKSEKNHLISSFFGINIEELNETPDLQVSLEGFFGGEAKEAMSKSYVQNFGENLKTSDMFVIFEFIVKDKSKNESLIKKLTNLANVIRESLQGISNKISAFINNGISIKVLKKSEDVICLSFKIRRSLKEEFSSFENALNLLIDESITQNVCVSFCLSGNMEKVRNNPSSIFIDTLDLGASLQLKTQLLKKNLKFLTKLIKPIPRFMKFWINSFGGSHIDLKFNTDYLKSLNNSLLNQANGLIVDFIKGHLYEIVKDVLSAFGGFSTFKNLFEAFKENYTIAVNCRQFYLNFNADILGLLELLK